MPPAGQKVLGAWALVVAAGRGERFGGPKQYETLGGRTVLERSVEVARATCQGVIVVAAEEHLARARKLVGPDIAVVAGGPSRSASVRAGLGALPPAAELVAVHDAARPLASADLWFGVLGALADGADGAIPVVAVTDTIKQVDGAAVTTLDRSRLVAVQTPQAFRVPLLRRAHAGCAEATDDAALVEAIGGRVVLVEGDTGNLKITSPHDLAVAAALIGCRRPGVGR